MIGAITTNSAAIVRRPVGNRRHQGIMLQLAINPRSQTPVIRCPESGKVWSISWDKLMDLAIGDGISTPVDEAVESVSEASS